MSPEESRIALLELKVLQMERRLTNIWRDVMQLLALGLVLFPLLSRQLPGEYPLEIRIALGLALATAVTGLGAWIRERRQVRIDAEKTESIYLSIRP